MAHPIFRLERVARPTPFSLASLSSAQSLRGVAGELVGWLRDQCLTRYQLVEPMASPSATPNVHATPALQGIDAPLAPLSQGESARRAQSAQSARPQLRVVMVHDAQSPSKACSTRMVISGRMADVCAELDRLAA